MGKLLQFSPIRDACQVCNPQNYSAHVHALINQILAEMAQLSTRRFQFNFEQVPF